MLPFSIFFSQQENDLLSSEMLSFESCLGSMKILDHITFFEPAFERLEHFSTNLPVLITRNTTGDFRLLDPHVSNNSHCLVITSQITEGWPIRIVLCGEKARQDKNNDGGFE